MKIQIEQELRLTGVTLYNILIDDKFVTCDSNLEKVQQMVSDIEKGLAKKEIIFEKEI
jgi:hypothetical protein